MKSPTFLIALILIVVVCLFPVIARRHRDPSPIDYLTTAYNAFTASFNSPTIIHPSAKATQEWLQYDPTLTGTDHIIDVRTRFLSKMKETASAWKSMAEGLLSPIRPSDDSSTYPYWRMIPAHIINLVPGETNNPIWSSPCFTETSAVVTKRPDGNYTVSLTLLKASSGACTDSYLFGTLEGYTIQSFSCIGIPEWCDQHQEIIWTVAADVTLAELWDINTNGIRVFRFTDDTLTTIDELTTTLDLFNSLSTSKVDPNDAAINIDFLAKYAHVYMQPRSITSVPIDESLIQSGDFFGVIRLDGLDPMLAWAMGSHTGHTVLALRIGGELYIIESTNKNAYWDTNGVQKTPYNEWITKAIAADYQVVWSPLTSAAASIFNETSAIEYFNSVEGYDYGYQSMLWAWQDTIQDNYPCLPPNFTLCLKPAHVQCLFGYFHRSLPSLDILYLEAWNKRVNTTGLSVAEVLMVANRTGIQAEVLPSIVERDEWLYNTTRYGEVMNGPALVCCVFVCEVWKHAGLFGKLADSIACSEQTNTDVYSLNILQIPKERPSQCIKADPNNTLCQLTGDYTLDLGSEYGSRPPYAHMDEHCPSLAPDYKRTPGC